MKVARKVRVTVSLASDLVERIDAEARSRGESRSGVIESWLRETERAKAKAKLDAEIEAYYTSLTPAEKAEDERLTRAITKAGIEVLRASERDARRRRRRG